MMHEEPQQRAVCRRQRSKNACLLAPLIPESGPWNLVLSEDSFLPCCRAATTAYDLRSKFTRGHAKRTVWARFKDSVLYFGGAEI